MTQDARDLDAARAGGAGGKGEGDANSHQAFARIYDRHAPVVLSLCRRHSPSDTDADDALQETFLRAYKMLDKVEDPDMLRSWLYAIARRVCSERRRAAGRRTRHERAAFGIQPGERARLGAGGASMNHVAEHARDSAPIADAAFEHADRSEQLAHLSKAIDSLPDNERLAIHLYYLDVDPIAAATSALGVSRSGFYKLLARARERLASVMSEAHT